MMNGGFTRPTAAVFASFETRFAPPQDEDRQHRGLTFLNLRSVRRARLDGRKSDDPTRYFFSRVVAISCFSSLALIAPGTIVSPTIKDGVPSRSRLLPRSRLLLSSLSTSGERMSWRARSTSSPDAAATLKITA